MLAHTPAPWRPPLRTSTGSHPAGNRNATLYEVVRSRFEPIPEPKLVVDTDAAVDLERLVREIG